MRCLKLTLAYDGTNYVGWQRQTNGVSIQQLIEEACAPLAGNEIPDVAGASRTDAGVHAIAQVASVHLESTLSSDTIARALNFRLPADVRVMSVEDASPDFHARFDATAKTYRYRIVTGPVLSPFDRWFVHHAPEARDLDAMRLAAAMLVGRHDFASFQTGSPARQPRWGAETGSPARQPRWGARAAGGDAADTVRTIHRLDLCARDGELVLEIEGDGFLRHMVRTIAGTLIEIGTGRRPAADMSGILDARDRRAAGRTAPASGLTLIAVRYARNGAVGQ